MAKIIMLAQAENEILRMIKIRSVPNVLGKCEAVSSKDLLRDKEPEMSYTYLDTELGVPRLDLMCTSSAKEASDKLRTLYPLLLVLKEHEIPLRLAQ